MEIHSVPPISSLYLPDGRELSKSSAQLGGSKQQLFEAFSQLEYLSWCTTADYEIPTSASIQPLLKLQSVGK